MSTLGLLLQLRPFAKYLLDSFFTRGLQSARDLHGIAVGAVDRRLKATDEACDGRHTRHDTLEMLVKAKDPQGMPILREELTSEALTQLITGSDMVPNTSCAIIYWILHGTPGTIVPKAAIPEGEFVATHEQVKNLPFLRQCIDEGMR